MSSETTKYDISIASGLGNMIAVTISWSVNHSVGWTILHGLFGWFYVIYYACGGGHRG